MKESCILVHLVMSYGRLKIVFLRVKGPYRGRIDPHIAVNRIALTGSHSKALNVLYLEQILRFLIFVLVKKL